MAKKKEAAKASSAWLNSYGDMITLMLCFFVMLYNPSEVDIVQMAELTASIHGESGGGFSLAAGRLADLGNTINSLPSIEKGKSLGLAVKRAVSVFAPDVKSNKITLTLAEPAVITPGLVITLAGDSFFAEGSAELRIDETRETLLRLAQFLSGADLANRRFRIEGHTDNTPVAGENFPSNWELSTARATNVLHYLSDFGVNEAQFSVAGYADTRAKASNDTAEGRAYNRRVDIIILDDGHF